MILGQTMSSAESVAAVTTLERKKRLLTTFLALHVIVRLSFHYNVNVYTFFSKPNRKQEPHPRTKQETQCPCICFYISLLLSGKLPLPFIKTAVKKKSLRFDLVLC
jgi:hypothetical protein